ncbi:hypothetical protein B9Z19DRAFT_1078262 [Tuber borchii]|uniref:Uncharacterized protein n=1 Tax=Tuber borchii TaxID=42251 RepID=A0A2T6ZZV2_TUBBO|nr:hypothetical protein B9Z19DRAFT_1078262 [Tuber borchii]
MLLRMEKCRIRAFIRDVVITLATDISRTRNRIAREISYVKNIKQAECPPSTRSHEDDPEASTLRKIKAEAPFGTLGTAGKRPHPSSVIMAQKFGGEPPLRLLPVREVVDIEKYDPEAPIELIPEGYVKQYVIDDNDNGRTSIVLLEDPSYNGYRPKKRLAKERPDTPNKLPRDNVPQTRPWQKIASSPTPTNPISHSRRRGGAQGGQVLIPEQVPRLMPYSQSQEATPVPTDRKHNWAAESGHNAGWRKDGTKNGIESDGDDEHDKDYRGDDEDETEYAGSGGTETDTEYPQT